MHQWRATFSIGLHYILLTIKPLCFFLLTAFNWFLYGKKRLKKYMATTLSLSSVQSVIKMYQDWILKYFNFKIWINMFVLLNNIEWKRDNFSLYMAVEICRLFFFFFFFFKFLFGQQVMAKYRIAFSRFTCIWFFFFVFLN